MDADLRREIHYDLEYHGDDLDMRAAIISALGRMPEDVRRFALDRCRYLSVGGTLAGYAVPGRIGVDPFTRRTRNVWLVVLTDVHEDLEGLVAHEIAHLWLQQSETGNIAGREAWTAAEEAAEALCREWGFEGPGADASSRHAPFRGPEPAQS